MTEPSAYEGKEVRPWSEWVCPSSSVFERWSSEGVEGTQKLCMN